MIGLCLSLSLITLLFGFSWTKSQDLLNSLYLKAFQKQTFAFLNIQRQEAVLAQEERFCSIQNNQLCCGPKQQPDSCLKAPLNGRLTVNRPLSFKPSGRGQSGQLTLYLNQHLKTITADAITGYLRAKP